MSFAELPLVHTVLQHPRIYAGVGAGALLALSVIGWLILRKKPTAEELERRRREQLAAAGRIIDGIIVEATGDAEETPDILVYKYELAGVEYECAQDVSRLHDHIARLRWDLPVTIKYDPRNPCNSIVLAESWSGLRGGSDRRAVGV